MASNKKVRLDHLLVERGLAENPSKARARIMAGDVIVEDHRLDKPGAKISINSDIRLRGNSNPFVSRGGLKLKKALELWPAPINGAICLDVGASTGGFTDVLLKSGAKKVYAIDVGYGQLHETLRVDKRVINLERTHILSIDKLKETPSIAVIDVSFISLEKILPKVKELLAKESFVYALIKPQFEAGPEFIAKGGIVKDKHVHEAVIEKIKTLSKALGLKILGVAQSPILGAKGNVEFLVSFTN